MGTREPFTVKQYSSSPSAIRWCWESAFLNSKMWRNLFGQSTKHASEWWLKSDGRLGTARWFCQRDLDPIWEQVRALGALGSNSPVVIPSRGTVVHIFSIMISGLRLKALDTMCSSVRSHRRKLLRWRWARA